MAKPYRRAGLISFILTLIAVAGGIYGVLNMNALIAIVSLLPAVIYEAYRTEGPSTRFASWALLVLLVGEIVLIVGDINLDLARLLGSSQTSVAGWTVPLGDIKVVGPAVMAILAAVLYTRTRGRYTKWLSVIIILGSLATLYILEPRLFDWLLDLVAT